MGTAGQGQGQPPHGVWRWHSISPLQHAPRCQPGGDTSVSPLRPQAQRPKSLLAKALKPPEVERRGMSLSATADNEGPPGASRQGLLGWGGLHAVLTPASLHSPLPDRGPQRWGPPWQQKDGSPVQRSQARWPQPQHHTHAGWSPCHRLHHRRQLVGKLRHGEATSSPTSPTRGGGVWAGHWLGGATPRLRSCSPSRLRGTRGSSRSLGPVQDPLAWGTQQPPAQILPAPTCLRPSKLIVCRLPPSPRLRGGHLRQHPPSSTETGGTLVGLREEGAGRAGERGGRRGVLTG